MVKHQMKMHVYSGSEDQEKLIEWIEELHLYFECNKVEDYMRVKMVYIKFNSYAFVWWEYLKMDRKKYRKGKYLEMGKYDH
jgi:hypothetical protein